MGVMKKIRKNDLVEVTASASFTPITPMISQIFGTRTLSSTSRTGIHQ